MKEARFYGKIKKEKERIKKENERKTAKENRKKDKKIGKAFRRYSKKLDHIDEKLDDINDMANNLPVKETKGIKKMFKKIAVIFGLSVPTVASIASIAGSTNNLKEALDEVESKARVESDFDEIDNATVVNIGKDLSIDLEKNVVNVKINNAASKVASMGKESSDKKYSLKEMLASQVTTPEETAKDLPSKDPVYGKEAKNLEIDNLENTVENAASKVGAKDLNNPSLIDSVEESKLQDEEKPTIGEKETTKVENSKEETTKKEVHTFTFEDDKENTIQEEETTKTVVIEDTNANISAGTVTNNKGKQEEAIIVDTERDGNTDVVLSDGNGTTINKKGESEAVKAPLTEKDILNNGKYSGEETIEEDDNGRIDPVDPFEER